MLTVDWKRWSCLTRLMLKISSYLFQLDLPVQTEKALESGRKLQVQLDGNIATATLERKLKVKSLAALRKTLQKMPHRLLTYSNISTALLYLLKEKITLK